MTTGLEAFASWKSAIEARLAFQLDQAQARMIDQMGGQGQGVPGAQAALTRLIQAMRHGVLNGGKRARGLLLMAAAQAGGADPIQQDVLDAACAVEFVHAFSLVHDDMPCMDDDDLRRGQPTVHVAYDEPTALLVGDALQTLAFECLSVGSGPADRQLRLIRCLAQATGAWQSDDGRTTVLLTCGLEPPAPSTLPCQTAGGVDWLIDDAEAPNYRFTTYGRTPAVEVYLDYDEVSARTVLDTLGTAVQQLPVTAAACTERPEG